MQLDNDALESVGEVGSDAPAVRGKAETLRQNPYGYPVCRMLEERIRERFGKYYDILEEQLTPEIMEQETVTLQKHGVTVILTDPVLRELLQEREELRQQSASGRGDCPVPETQPKGKNRRASINISIGQTRRHAIKKGICQPGDPLPDGVVNQIVREQGLCRGDGSVPLEIRRKIQFGEVLNEVDFQWLGMRRQSS